MPIIIGLWLILLLGACSQDADTTDEKPPNNTQQTLDDKAVPKMSAQAARIEVISAKTIEAIRHKDFETLAQLVHPSKGIRFSAYAYVDIKNDQVFSPNQIASTLSDQQRYHWGNYDGSGDPIELTFGEYFEDFVYDADFANAEKISYDQQLCSGNSINNAAEVYPSSRVVEYCFSGFKPEMEGMDWRALRLVFMPYQQSWRLVGVIHDQWTV